VIFPIKSFHVKNNVSLLVMCIILSHTHPSLISLMVWIDCPITFGEKSPPLQTLRIKACSYEFSLLVVLNNLKARILAAKVNF